jgi:hypothetical protein
MNAIKTVVVEGVYTVGEIVLGQPALTPFSTWRNLGRPRGEIARLRWLAEQERWAKMEWQRVYDVVK